MRYLKILLIGQPNVGKSSLLNALVGPKVVVSNYPGTTVEITQAEKVFNDTKIKFLDTPGIYSISDRSREEKVTEEALFEEKSDGVVIIADAFSLERSLYLVLQILEAEIPCIIALNFIEDAEKKGTEIDAGSLGNILGVPVIPINPLVKKGTDLLLNSIIDIKRNEFYTVKYDDDIERAIDEISPQIKEISLPRRFVAIRILERDEDFYRYLKDDKIIREVRKNLREHPKVEEDISITRYGTASFIAEKVTEIISLKQKKGLPIQARIDNVFFHRFWGSVSTVLLSLVIFGLLLYLGNVIENFLMGLTENLLFLFGMAQHSIIATVLIQGLTGAAAGISIALPYVFLFYLILGLFEDIGLL
ncbi:MAG: ferrous iron transporter B, partial [Deltaproteobacteria bacterium]|nr:ferrous iron transporter B [Deltaproteobacteria bacterium]